MRVPLRTYLFLVLCTTTTVVSAQSSGPIANRGPSTSRPQLASTSGIRPTQHYRQPLSSNLNKAATGVIGSAAATAARTSFGSIIETATMLTVGLVPLSFMAGPLPAHTPLYHKLQCVYYFLSVASLANELLAIMYATVASIKLAEVAVEPAVAFSAADLIKQDFELHWLGCRVHLMAGLLGFMGMVLIRAYTLFPFPLNQAAAGLAGAALLGMLSIANVGVAEGDGRNDLFGGNMLTLSLRYLWLQVKNVWQRKGLVALAALVLGLASIGNAGYNLFMPETYQPTSASRKK